MSKLKQTKTTPTQASKLVQAKYSMQVQVSSNVLHVVNILHQLLNSAGCLYSRSGTREGGRSYKTWMESF